MSARCMRSFRLRLLQWATVLAARMALVSACSTDAACVSTCSVATSSGPCLRSACDATYQRCTCGDDAALRTDGGCEGTPPIVVGGCQLGYSARIFAAVPASPELRPADLTTGRASAALITILRRSLAAGLGREAHEIAATKVKLMSTRRLLGGSLQIGNSSTDSANSTQAELLQVDLRFDFCTGTPSLPLDLLSSSSFDSSFDQEIHRYAAMSLATARVTRVILISTVTSTTSTRQSILVIANDGENASDTDTLARLWWVWWFLLIPLAVVACFVWIRGRRRNTKTMPFEETTPHASAGGPPRRVPSGPLLAQLPRVCANVAFSREHLGLQDGEEVQTLALQEGDMVEVMMNAGEWLFGRRVGKPDERGYFPESHVSWLGRPVEGAADFSSRMMLPVDGASSPNVEPDTIGLPAGSLREVGQGAGVNSAGDLPLPPSIEAPTPLNTAIGYNAETGGVVTGTPVATPRLGTDEVATATTVTPQPSPYSEQHDTTLHALQRPPALDSRAEPVFRLGSSEVSRDEGGTNTSTPGPVSGPDNASSLPSLPTFVAEPPEGPPELLPVRSPSFSDMPLDPTTARFGA